MGGPSAFDGGWVFLKGADLNLGDGPALVEEVPRGSNVFVFGYDAARGRSHLFPRGELVLSAASDSSGSRIQHQAPGSVCSDGGALILANGALIGIVTTGSDGISEAKPCRGRDRLKASVGEEQLQNTSLIQIVGSRLSSTGK